MALFGIGKKAETQQAATPAAPAQQGDVLVNEIRRMQSGGQSNSQIVQQLQRQGYKTYQIFDAFNTIDLGGKAGPIDQPVPPDPDMMQPEQQMPQAPYGAAAPSMSQGQPDAPYEQPMQYGGGGYDQGGYDQGAQMYEQQPMMEQQSPDQEERIEELVEAIVEEKWEELVRNVNKIIAWKNVMENRLTILEQRFQDMKMQFEDLNKGVLDKMSEYDQNITNVGTEIKAMEEVFKKVLPTFTENISELNRLTKQMKQLQPKK